MTKLSILFCLLAALVCSAAAADEEVKKAQDKVLVIKEHILHTGDVDKKAFEKIHLEKDSKPMAELQPSAAVESKPDEKIPVQPGSLQPILPMLNGMSPFLKSIFDSVASSDNANNNNEQQQQQQQQLLVDPVPMADSEQQPPKRHGIMTIVFMKAIRNPAGAGMEDHQLPSDLADQDQQQQQQQPQGGIMHIQLRPNIGLMLNQILPRRVSQMLGIDAASADDDMSMMKPMQLIGADDLDRVANQHLLGGKDDIADHFRAFNDDVSSFGDDTKLQPDEISSFQIGGQEPSFLLRPAHDENQKQPKKCMMMSFMRLKASAYYRTIVHLLFFSGIILLILFMIILAIRVYKRSKALRYYNQNINIATIDDQAYPTKRGANSYLFRSGSIRSSYEQKQALANDLKASPLMYHVSPPAYEQIISTSINNSNDDAKSVTSLPDYQESVSKKNPESNA